MTGNLLLEDWQKAVTERLQQHARDAFQAVEQANQPPLASVGSTIPNPPIDPNVAAQAITARLQQHGQGVWDALQQANQPPLQNVQIDPNEVTARLQQHAQDAFQAVDQNVQAIGTGLQQANQPPLAPVQTPPLAAQDVSQGVQPATQPSTGGPEPANQVDSSSHASFVSSLQPYADKWAKITGIPSDYLMAWAASESNWGKAGNALFGIKQSSQPGTAAGLTSATWEQGQGATTDTFANYNSPDQAFQALDQFLQGSRYRDVYNAVRGGQITADQFMQGINAAGYATDPIWGQKIGQIASNSIAPLMDKAGRVVETGRQAVANAVLPTLSQFGDKQLTSVEAYGACGPAAAVRFAQLFGRNPTLREATDLAKNVGWSEGQGMAGLQSESKLFNEMGIAHRVLGADWQAFAHEAQSGNPVTLSTPGHYFTADAYDPRSGAFHVGSSGTDLRGGSEWMTPAQMEQRMGALQGGLAADNPNIPGSSPLSAPPSSSVDTRARELDRSRGVLRQGGQAIQEGLQSLDSTIKDLSGNVQQAVDQNIVQPVKRGVDEALAVIQSPETGNPLIDVPGTLASAEGTIAQNALTGLRNITPTSELARGALGQEQIVSENKDLFDQQQRLVDEFAGAQQRGDQGAMDRIKQDMDALQAQLPDARSRDVLHAAAERNPSLPLVETGTNLAGAAAAAPLAAEGAPVAARALATAIDPGTGLPSLIVRGLEALRPGARQILTAAAEADRPAVAAAQDVVGQVQKMPGTAELAPVRETVAQTGSDLLQAMLEQAKQRGADPEKVAALQKQIDAFDPEAATRRALSGGQGGFTAPALEATTAAVEPAVPTTRMYHGTASEFERPMAEHFDQNGLYGPGYYLTSDPRVAGGIVGDEGIVRPGYAHGEQNGFTALQADLQGVTDQLKQPGLSDRMRYMLEQRQGDLTRRIGELTPTTGPNVRPVDVPQNLKLFDADAPLDIGLLDRITSLLDPKDAHSLESALPYKTGRPDKWTNDVLYRKLSEITDTPYANHLLREAGGFDGVTHTGGLRVPMKDVAGEPIEHQVHVIFPESLDKIRNALSGRQGGAISVRAATTLGGAVAGGKAGYESTPEDALTIPTPFGDIPIERGIRTVAGAGAGAGLGSAVGGFRGPLEQQILENLRQGGLVSGPARPAQNLGPIARGVDITKQSILSNPATHIANVIGNTIELARQPVALAMGGRGDDALAGLVSVGRGIGEAGANAWSAIRGNQVATLAGEKGNIPARSPIFRLLSASDAFTRTLGEYQGMASEANRLLREAGMTPGDPGAASYLASHAADLYREGTRAGAQSVFGRVATASQGTSVLDNMFRRYANVKDGLLNSSSLREQAMGALMDFAIPFSGVPVQMLQIGLNRLPVTAQASGAVRAARALKAGDMAGATRAVGETGLETAIQLMIAKGVAGGNITGPDDPDHPNSIRVNGTWMSMNDWGAYSLPMQIMASFADGFEKGGHDVPAGASVGEYYGPRFQAAFNASLKPFKQGIPGENIIRLLARVGEPGGATGAALGTAQDVFSRIANPGALRFLENLTDPVAREVDRKGIASLWEPAQANIPGLSRMLPGKIDPTTGEVLSKVKSGPGILIGAQQEDVSSPITVEANRLKKAGFDITPPKTYPDKVTIGGAEVHLKPDEQRKVVAITGKTLGNFAAQLDQASYQNASDPRKALMMQAYLNAADRMRLSAVRQVLGQDELRSRIVKGQQTVGRLNVQAAPPELPSVSRLLQQGVA